MRLFWDHVYVTVWKPVTISKPNFSWLPKCRMWPFHLYHRLLYYAYRMCLITSWLIDHMHLTSPKSDLNSWKDKRGSKLSQNGQKMKIMYSRLHQSRYVENLRLVVVLMLQYFTMMTLHRISILSIIANINIVIWRNNHILGIVLLAVGYVNWWGDMGKWTRSRKQ